jgi:mRNA interferase MazF
MVINKGDILLVQFPYTDLSQVKLRPAIVLQSSSIRDETTLCFISSQQVNQLTDDEFALLDSDTEFSSTGLRSSSKVRVSRIVTLNHQLTSRRLSCLGTEQLKILDEKLKHVFQLP